MNRFVDFFIVICLVFLFIRVVTMRNIEGLQNYKGDDDILDLDKFGNMIKSEDDPELSDILTDPFYNPTNFTSDKSFYKNDEISNDIKFFNNTSHILMGYLRKQLIPKSYSKSE
jgi:hypothetical protein